MNFISRFNLLCASVALVSSFAANAETTGVKAEIFVQLGHRDSVNAVAFSPDARSIVSGGVGPSFRFGGNTPGTIKIWDVASGRELRTLSGHSSDVTAVAFSPDGRTIVSGSKDNTIKRWNVFSGVPSLQE